MILLKRLLGRTGTPGRGRHSARAVAVGPVSVSQPANLFIRRDSEPSATHIDVPLAQPVLESVALLGEFGAELVGAPDPIPESMADPTLLDIPEQRVMLGFEDGTEVVLAFDDPRSLALQSMADVLTGPLPTMSKPSRTP